MTDPVSNTNNSPPYLQKNATVQQVGLSETVTVLNSTNLNEFSPYPISMLYTVDHNKGYFTRCKIEGANVAIDLPTCIGLPAPIKFKPIVKSGCLKNEKITVENIARDKYIHGKLVILSKEKQFDRKTLCTRK